METAKGRVELLADEIGRVVVGQRALVDGLLVALLCSGHALVEGVPGLAKTTVIRTSRDPTSGLLPIQCQLF